MKNKCDVCGRFVGGYIHNIDIDIGNIGIYRDVFYDTSYGIDGGYIDLFLICGKHTLHHNETKGNIKIPDYIPVEQYKKYLKQLIKKDDKS